MKTINRSYFEKREKNKILWMMANRSSIFVGDMSKSHIKNTINCLLGKGKSIIPKNHCGLSHKEWLGIF